MDTVSIDPFLLHSRLGRADSPLVLDVRRPPAFDGDDRLLAGAARPPDDLLAWMARQGHRGPVVAYCVHGHEVSRGAAAALARAGFEACFLEGGLAAWREAGLPTVRRRPEWQVPGGSRWITRERPRIDRIACPWLIRRFIDPLAVFHYVPAACVLAEAQARNAVPYDVPDAVVGHRGPRCSFDALLEDFELTDAALGKLATIVRGADTGRPELAAACAPLLAASVRLSERFADDHEMLAHAMPLYDDLYAWCRGEVAGSNGGRSWTPGQ